jgi:hypothetical protein
MKGSIFLDITLCIPLKISAVSEEYVASIFSDEESAKKKVNVKHVASYYLFINIALIIGMKSY